MDDTIIHIAGHGFFIPGHAIQIFLAGFFGFIIGCERAWRGKAASIKTFSALCVGSCVFTILSYEGAGRGTSDHYDITRIAAQIVTGVGFIGGGVIFKTADRVEGITTAALAWMAAAMGMAIGFGRVELVIWTFIIGALFHSLSYLLHYLIFVERTKKKNGVHRRTPPASIEGEPL